MQLTALRHQLSSAQDSAGPVPGRLDRQGACTPAVRFPRTGPPPAPAHPGRARSRPHADLREPEAPWSGQQGPQVLDTVPPAAARASPTRRTLPSWPGPPQQEAGEAPGSRTGSVLGGEGCCPHRALTAGGGGCSWAGLTPSPPSRGGRLTEERRHMSAQHLQSLVEGPPAPWHWGPVWKRGRGGELGEAFRDPCVRGLLPRKPGTSAPQEVISALTGGLPCGGSRLSPDTHTRLGAPLWGGPCPGRVAGSPALSCLGRALLSKDTAGSTCLTRTL